MPKIDLAHIFLKRTSVIMLKILDTDAIVTFRESRLKNLDNENCLEYNMFQLIQISLLETWLSFCR